jgi:phospho-N-acetylmuramoyl-pentapeptide-transferase
MKGTSISLALTFFSFMLAVIWGGPLIKLLKRLRIGKLIRVEEPSSHNVKMGTPTMGGFMIIVPVLLLTVLMNAAQLLGFKVLGRSVLLPVLTILSFGILGALDDWEGVRGARRGIGMRARTKFLIQVAFAVVIAYAIKYIMHAPQMYFPGIDYPIDLGPFYIPIAVIIIVGMSNAVNFTDGMDGLAGLIAATAFAAYGIIALAQGLDFLGRFCFTLVGAIFGFLWFNVHPADLFMGDTGSLSLGAVLGVVALMTGHWVILPIIAIIPFSELLSVILQVIYFKLTKGRRLFKMAPFHYHFELMGWSETQVVQRFWLVGLMFAMIGIALAMV